MTDTLAPEVESIAQFVQRVDAWRTSLGLTHRQFAALLGRPESEWSHYRHGRRPPSDEFVVAVLARTRTPWRDVLESAYAAYKLAQLKSAVPAAPGAPVASVA